MTFLVDMNLSPLWVPFLQEHGHSAVHWSTIGPVSAPDTTILDHAESHGLVVFTHDLDFGRLLAMRRSRGPSVVQIRSQESLPSAMGAIFLAALSVSGHHLEAGALMTVDPVHHRVRLLPF
jgi:predicted nuclease of predicted toxin-antitoxin system